MLYLLVFTKRHFYLQVNVILIIGRSHTQWLQKYKHFSRAGLLNHKILILVMYCILGIKVVDLATYSTMKTSIAAWNYLSHAAPDLEKNV